MRKKGGAFTNVPEPLADYTLPEEGKTYRHQAALAARSMEKHDAWRRETLSPHQYSMVLDWYQSAMPLELYNETMAKIAQQNKTAVSGPTTPSCG